ncbi:glycosyltransferase family 2 protein [Aureivirga sp. CE67]|uniref:glycosyltransferase family 2 protein n=1 Tax=Aureivirga sp. CE67 TaxID=1788983 RepID=UPI0018C903F9|nr:glycosyltransferase family 2 protein [Aureivirga sp. CE67]
MTTAIVILNWNGKGLLEKYIPIVLKYSKGATVYVADNASTDDSVSFIKENFEEVKIIQNAENTGYAGGYNESLQFVEEDILALVNSDIEVTENWLAPILKTFEKEENTAIIQPKILDEKKKTHFEYAGAAGGYVDKYGYAFCRGRIFNTLEKDENQYDNETSIFWASGACLFIRNSVFKSVNGFDMDFFAHYEEIDLCWRVKSLGYDVKFVGKSTVYHVGGATLENTSPFKTYLNFRNSLFTLLKNLPKGKLFPVIFTRMVLDGIAGVRFLTQFQFSHFFSILKAHFSFYKNLGKMYKKRTDNQISDYYEVNNIVSQYFIKGKKFFSVLKK